MVTIINCATFKGIIGKIVKVEIHMCAGLPSFNIVGLGDTSVKESKERVRAAILNSGYEFPLGRITVNLAPADLKKEGSIFDLSIAIGILIASKQIKNEILENTIILGELSLDGNLNKVKGILPIIYTAKENNYKNFIIPIKNLKEASLVKKINIYPMKNLNSVIDFFQYKDILPYEVSNNIKEDLEENLDFCDVIGQENAKRALEIAAAGAHNLLLYGPAGSGKSMLAKRFKSILPDLNYNQALEVAKIYSVLGENNNVGINFKPPFRSPHNTITSTALIGGGHNLLPGEISLAHNGILFLDEILEFKKNVLEMLRQPLEDKSIVITRMKGSYTYPADFILLSAMNPCPCGNFLSNKQCTCTVEERKRYVKRLSSALLDRIDMYVSVPNLPFKDFQSDTGESSKKIKERVIKARKIQEKRYKKMNIYTNSHMSTFLLKEYCRLGNKEEKLLENMFNKYNLSGRAYSRVLKISRTIADLNEDKSVKSKHLIEAFNYRNFLKENIG